jgi:hypothetical protein
LPAIDLHNVISIGISRQRDLTAGTKIEWPKKAEQPPTSRDREQSLCFVNQKIQWNLRELAMMVRVDLTNLERTNISTLIAKDVHSSNTVTEMMA